MSKPMKEGAMHRETYAVIIPCFSREDQNRTVDLIAKALSGYTETKDKEKAASMLEDVIDTLIEVGNGITYKMLHEAASELIKARDILFYDDDKKSVTCYALGKAAQRVDQADPDNAIIMLRAYQQYPEKSKEKFLQPHEKRRAMCKDCSYSVPADNGDCYWCEKGCFEVYGFSKICDDALIE